MAPNAATKAVHRNRVLIPSFYTTFLRYALAKRLRRIKQYFDHSFGCHEEFHCPRKRETFTQYRRRKVAATFGHKEGMNAEGVPRGALR